MELMNTPFGRQFQAICKSTLFLINKICISLGFSSLRTLIEPKDGY